MITGIEKNSLVKNCASTLSTCSEDVCIVSISVSKTAVLEWLEAQHIFPQFYWGDPSRSYEAAAVGNAKSFLPSNEEVSPLERCMSFLRTHSQGESLKIFGGRSFSLRSCDSSLWEAFPLEYFFLPRFLLERRHNDYTLTLALDRQSLEGADSPEKLLHETLSELRDSAPLRPISPSCVREDQENERSEWRAQVRRAVSTIENNQLKKVVIARKCTLLSDENISSYSVLQKVRSTSSNGVSFAFTPISGNTFLGVSPECLFRIQGSFLEADSLGGTIATSQIEREDRALREQMLSDKKLLHEHRLVTLDLRTKFLRVAESVLLDGKPGVLRLSSVQHLYSRLSGVLRKDLTVADILPLFHPTPAVCGEPQMEALRFIEERESFSRGWYAGPIGVVSKFYSEFRVGIRSLLHSGDRLHLFTGAGIVAGSDPEVEYEELERKTAPFFSVLLKSLE